MAVSKRKYPGQCGGEGTEIRGDGSAMNTVMERVDDNLMSEIVRRIVAAARPEKVILFGSRARGDARLDSDIDLLVVADDPQPRSLRASAIYGVLSDILIPMDIIVYRPEEIEEWRNVPQAFVTTAVREGSILYENHG